MLCLDLEFQKYTTTIKHGYDMRGGYNPETLARLVILDLCGINSRSELAYNKAAQERFMDMERQFNNFKHPIDEIYKDNLERME